MEKIAADKEADRLSTFPASTKKRFVHLQVNSYRIIIFILS
ncbi:hypothetical protein B4110_2568 [Parageobacillus toebii]|uniref:Uncharacterized protein n=1 Tax=Parageobacillus toebii TaxID=153151 RepID=A0A150MMP9_9BACL|nr:hypothetical protein B4110_2568 [Parageobacillus toebii]